MNQIILVGKIKEEPRYELTASGINYATMLVEVPRNFDDDQSDTFQVTLWKQVADYLKEKGRVNDLVGIKGRLKPNNYQRGEDDIIYHSDVICERITFINE